MKHTLSWWEKSVILRPFDFVVLGAGLIGKQIALKIKKKYPLSRIAFIDRSPVSFGASTRNAGFACFGSVSEIMDDFSRSSQEDVIRLAVKRYTGIQKLLEEFGAEPIGFRQTGSCEIFENKEDFESAEANFERINRLLFETAGLKNTFSLKNTSGMGMRTMPQCLFNPFEGMLDSGKLNETIGEMAHKAGVIPLYGLDIKYIEKINQGYMLQSSQGMDIRCAQLILANNAYAAEFLPEEDIVPARGQILLTEPIRDLPFDGIFHSDKGYIYFRNLEDRILIGGGRNYFRDQEQTYDLNESAELRNFLEDYLRKTVIPGKPFKTDMHWSGIMAMGKEKIPILKRIDQNLIACVRMSGMGVALGPVFSSEVLELLND